MKENFQQGKGTVEGTHYSGSCPRQSRQKNSVSDSITENQGDGNQREIHTGATLQRKPQSKKKTIHQGERKRWTVNKQVPKTENNLAERRVCKDEGTLSRTQREIKNQ